MVTAKCATGDHSKCDASVYVDQYNIRKCECSCHIKANEASRGVIDTRVKGSTGGTGRL